MFVSWVVMGASNTAVQCDILSKLALHRQRYPARTDYVGIEGCTPVDAPMDLSSRLKKKENRSWMTDTELACTHDQAAVELVRRAALRLWRSGEVEYATIRRIRTPHAREMWQMAFRLPATEEDRDFCAAWDDWFSRRDEAVFKAVCKTLIGKSAHISSIG
jgi:hypothetical protein